MVEILILIQFGPDRKINLPLGMSISRQPVNTIARMTSVVAYAEHLSDVVSQDDETTWQSLAGHALNLP